MPRTFVLEHIFRDTSIYIVNLQEFLEIPKAQKKVQTDYCLVEEKGPLIIPLVFLHFLLNTLWITEKENLHLECISNFLSCLCLDPFAYTLQSAVLHPFKGQNKWLEIGFWSFYLEEDIENVPT